MAGGVKGVINVRDGEVLTTVDEESSCGNGVQGGSGSGTGKGNKSSREVGDAGGGDGKAGVLRSYVKAFENSTL